MAALPLAASGLSAVPGDVFRWLGMMLAPGAAIYLASERRAPRLSVLVLCALVLSPIATTVLGIAGLALHVPVIMISGAISAVAIAAAGIAYATLRKKIALPQRRSLYWLGALLLALVVLTALLPMTHAWWRVRSDAWFHAAVVAQISDFGIPPQDPYFVGMPLQYMWFYHVLVLVLARGLDIDPFRVMTLVNIQALLGLGVCAWQLCGVFRQRLAYRLGATAMMLLGFNGAFWVFLPVKLVKALMGDVRGWAEIKRTYSIVPFNYDQACGFMNIYYNEEFFLDKFMVATAFGLALTFMVAGWYGASEFMRSRRPASLALFAVALVGMLGFHSLVGFVMLVGVFGGVILAWISFRRDGAFPVRAALVLLGVSLVCFLAMTPYIYGVMHLKEKEQVFPFGVSLMKTGGIFITCSFALFLALLRRPLLRERTVVSRFFVLGALSVTAFCLLIVLPGPNTYDKLGFLVFLPLSIVAGIALTDLWLETGGRARRWVAALTVACMLPVNALAFAACFATPDEATMTAPEARISLWLKDNTPRNALMIDDERVVFLVTVPRRYIFGWAPYAGMWGYPRLEMSRRAHMCRALYAPGKLDATALAVLGEFDEPVYAIVRPEHWRTDAAIVANPELFQTVYKDDNFRVVRVDTQACRARAAGMTDHLSPEELIRESGL